MKKSEIEKKYYVSYVSANTGFGWEKEYDRIEEFEDFVFSCGINQYIFVYDNHIDKILYSKRPLERKPDIDFLTNYVRDLRTKTRRRIIQ